jgi:hypothetical protein
MHVTLLILVPTCLALCDWQVHRALSGNGLSWAYVFEWPFFAGYGTYVWWKLVHDQMDQPSAGAPRSNGLGPDPATAPIEEKRPPSTEEDEELAEYNRYLAKLNATGRAKRW